MNHYGTYKGIELVSSSIREYIEQIIIGGDKADKMYFIEGTDKVMYKGKFYGTLDEKARNLYPSNVKSSHYEVFGEQLVEIIRSERKKAAAPKNASVANRNNKKKKPVVALDDETTLAVQMLNSVEENVVENLVDMTELEGLPAVEAE